MNELLEFITPENVIYEIKSVSKTDIIRELLEKAVAIHEINQENFEEIYDALLKREKSMSTGIGSSVAIPHCSVDAVDDVKCIMGISHAGLDFESIDKIPVQIFILLVVPRSKFQEHIKTLAVIAKTLNDKTERDKLIACHSYEDIIAAFKGVAH